MWAVSGVGMVASACATGRDSIKEPQSMTNQRVMSSDTVPVTQAELLPCPLPWCGAEAQLVGPYLCTATFTVNCTIHGDAVQTPHKRNPEDAIAAWNTRTTPAPAMPSREEIAALVARLRKRAQSESEARRMMMEAKSLRQPDNPEGRTDLYHWPKPEETDAWKAADLIAALTSVDRASETPQQSAKPAEGRDPELVGRLRIMSKQKLSGEMDSYDVDCADWQAGYEWFVLEARAIWSAMLSASPDRGEG